MEIFITRDITLKTRIETARPGQYLSITFDGSKFILDNEYEMYPDDIEALTAACKALSNKYTDACKALSNKYTDESEK